MAFIRTSKTRGTTGWREGKRTDVQANLAANTARSNRGVAASREKLVTAAIDRLEREYGGTSREE